MRKELEKCSCRAGEQGTLPQPPAGSGFSSQGGWEGVKMHNSCEGSTRGMEAAELQAAPVVQESLSCDAQPLFSELWGEQKQLLELEKEENLFSRQGEA